VSVPPRGLPRPILVLFLASGLAACGADHQSSPAMVAQTGFISVEPPGPAGVFGSSAPPAQSPSGHPAGSIYSPQAHGYDASYPQCSTGRMPRDAGFSIVGVNRGKAFTANPCLRSEWRSAGPRRAVYLNSGFNPRNYPSTTSECRRLSQRLHASGDRRSAYAIGCSEAVYSRAVMRASGIRESVMWWIDVEQANSWDEDDVNLNRFALQGEVDQLAAAGPLPGLYSTFKDWAAITGNWSPNGVVANWVAVSMPSMVCGSAGFSGAPVWLVQEADLWPDPYGVDSDWAC
jgi:hypothetical protein